MTETTPTPEALAQLFGALAKAQGEMTAAAKDRTNPHFRTQYADLAAVWAAVRGPLSKHSLCVMQFPAVYGDGRVGVRTVLAHSGGGSVAGELTCAVKAQDAQTIGSAITYLRRYGLMAIAGIAPDDDDGTSASDGTSATATAPPRSRPKPAADTKPPPDRPHHDSWKDAHKRWCAEIAREELTYKQVAAYFAAHGGLRPSEVDDAERARMLAHVRDPEGRVDIDTWLGQHEGGA